MKNLTPRRLLFLVLTLALFTHYLLLLQKSIWPSISETSRLASASRYYCPMHPSITSTHPDKCPICGMSLQRENSSVEGSIPTKERKILYYRHPMGKNATSPVPMKDEMGMDFIPVYEDEKEEAGVSLNDRTSILLSEASQQLIGVKKAKVEKKAFHYEIKASGRVAFDPDLYSAIAEYRVAKETAELTRNTARSVKDNSEALVSSSKMKLKLMGLSEEQIHALDNNTFDAKALLLPKGKLWVYAEVYEYELPYLKVGQALAAESPLYPNEHFEGKVVSINPILNAQTRTITIKGEISDSADLLKPDMFLTVRINVDLGEQLTVPESAVIHTGEIDLVFLVAESGRFEPRKVALGIKAKGSSVILSGLSEGDTVVVGANFLIDSESRLKAVVQNALSPSSSAKEIE